MAGVIFSDSFKVWRIDWDEKAKASVKKFDKGNKIINHVCNQCSQIVSESEGLIDMISFFDLPKKSI